MCRVEYILFQEGFLDDFLGKAGTSRAIEQMLGQLIQQVHTRCVQPGMPNSESSLDYHSLCCIRLLTRSI